MEKTMNKLKVALFDAKPYDQESFDNANKLAGEPYVIHYFPGHLTIDTVALTEGFDVVCAFVNDTITAEMTNVLYNNGIRLLALRCSGYNNIDLAAVFNKIHVVRVPAYSPHAVAEHAIALMMTLNRKTHKAYFRTRDGNFTLNGLLGFDLYNKTAGVVGTGKIGRIAINILRGFGMRVLASDKHQDQKFADETGCIYVPLEDLYKESDIITLHCPLTPENVHMINAESIAKMKTGVMIINTGRGKLINTQDLINGLKSHKIGAAGLDVYEEEEDYFFEDFSAETIGDDTLARLLTFPNVLITAHQAFFTREALQNIAETTFENIRQFFDEQKLPNEICYKCAEGTCPRKETGRCF